MLFPSPAVVASNKISNSTADRGSSSGTGVSPVSSWNTESHPYFTKPRSLASTLDAIMKMLLPWLVS